MCGAESLETRVVRGGSFNNNQRNARCAYRNNNNNPDNRNDNIGFRVVVSHDLYHMPEMRVG
jgi:formylglycine-generating enzyme required for sulfatase activity